jgi:hypothetical protein
VLQESSTEEHCLSVSAKSPSHLSNQTDGAVFEPSVSYPPNRLRWGWGVGYTDKTHQRRVAQLVRALP